MGARKSDPDQPLITPPRRPPGTTPEAVENELISLTVDLARRQLREGTASSQVMTHYLKLASSREKLEQQKLEQENKLTAAKIVALESAERVETLYKQALDAMRGYQGLDPLPTPDYEDFDE